MSVRVVRTVTRQFPVPWARSDCHRVWLEMEDRERCHLCGTMPVLSYKSLSTHVAACPRCVIGLTWLSSYERVVL
jgi:hypothetical protein